MTSPESPTDAGPLTQEHKAQLVDAMGRTRKISAAARLALVSGWVLGISAAITVPFAIFGSWALLLAGALGFIAWNEFRGRKLLVAFDERGARLLGLNQLGLMALIAAYCGWGIYVASNPTVSPEMAELQMLAPELDVTDLMSQLAIAVYTGVIFVTVILQGAMARYYFVRGPLIKAYKSETPEWIVDLQRAMAG